MYECVGETMTTHLHDTDTVLLFIVDYPSVLKDCSCLPFLVSFLEAAQNGEACTVEASVATFASCGSRLIFWTFFYEPLVSSSHLFGVWGFLRSTGKLDSSGRWRLENLSVSSAMRGSTMDTCSCVNPRRVLEESHAFPT